jgi:hypothetical protein
MRTKLDEIVEEECPMKGSFKASPWVHRVAERAFRHGVERARGWYLQTPAKDVQPEPVGEKTYAHPGCFRNTPHGAYECVEDRRKGQRRKGLEKQLVGIASVGPFMEHRESLFCVSGGSGWGEWRTDRRSGKDRRKA